jgi:hypothetical protein
MTMIDELFISRVYRSSFWWSLLVVSYLLMAKLLSAAVGFSIGVGVGLGVLRSIEGIVRIVFVPGNAGASKATMSALGIAKYALLAVIFALIVRSGWISLPAFACGVGVPSAIICLKMLSGFFAEIEFHPFWGSEFDPRPAREAE